MDENQNDAQAVQPDTNTEQTPSDGVDVNTLKEDFNKQLAERDQKIASFEEDIARLKRETKREIKKAQKADEPESKTEEFGLLEKSYLRAAGITAEDEIELAKDIQSKTNMDWDKLVDDDYFKSKLEGLREANATAAATSNVKGGAGEGQAKNTPEYWIAKGTPPTREDVPNRKTRAEIARAMMQNAKVGKTFYNE